MIRRFLRWRRYRRCLGSLVRDEMKAGRPVAGARYDELKEQARTAARATG